MVQNWCKVFYSIDRQTKGVQGYENRETLEEVGVDLSNTIGKLIHTLISEKYHVIEDTWLFNYDGEIDLSKATTNEVCEVKWMTKDEIKKSFDKGEFVPTLKYILEIGDKNEL